MTKEKKIFQYVILSIIATSLLLILTYFSQPISMDISDRLILGGLFFLSCIFGFSLSIRPGWYKRFTKQTNDNLNKRKSKTQKITFQGHHPTCGMFDNHTISIKEKIYCAGCFGLALGSLISIFLLVFYIVYGSIMEPFVHLLLPIGLIIITLVYVELILFRRHPLIHTVSNILLIVCFLLISISILEITGNKIYGIIGILFSFLWLDTRIQLSSWQHTRICTNCNKSCKMY